MILVDIIKLENWYKVDMANSNIKKVFVFQSNETKDSIYVPLCDISNCEQVECNFVKTSKLTIQKHTDNVVRCQLISYVLKTILKKADKDEPNSLFILSQMRYVIRHGGGEELEKNMMSVNMKEKELKTVVTLAKIDEVFDQKLDIIMKRWTAEGTKMIPTKDNIALKLFRLSSEPGFSDYLEAVEKQQMTVTNAIKHMVMIREKTKCHVSGNRFLSPKIYAKMVKVESGEIKILEIGPIAEQCDSEDMSDKEIFDFILVALSRQHFVEETYPDHIKIAVITSYSGSMGGVLYAHVDRYMDVSEYTDLSLNTSQLTSALSIGKETKVGMVRI
ncbi:unnamed protein product [Caenorhabditis angaria]|uniref:Uncharacterized protein n=1 Tax=Caenorhabditis angaria TaxID=860376 RepID=A0A9P1N034_9PELO|nr:unnamed protein product [Caenorhabditis angaria]